MDDPPPRHPLATLLRGAAVVLTVVVLGGLLARSPVTAPDAPLRPMPAGPATDEVTTPGSLVGERRGGAWLTIGRLPPIDLLRQGPGVWTGREVLVGFSPAVAAYSLDRPAPEAWRVLPPHPAGALQVRGAVQLGGDPVFVYGVKACAGCPWEPALYRLDPDDGGWERLRDAPGNASVNREVVLSVADQLVVVRDRGTAGIEAVAYDPATDAWRDLQSPVDEPLRWRAAAAGDAFVIVGAIAQSTDTRRPVALVYDLLAGAWRDATAGMPLHDPHDAAAVWTGTELVLFGASEREGGPRGAALSLADDTWTPLPDLPLGDPFLPALEGLGPLTGLSGVWDGQFALFVGGLTNRVFLAWSPDPGTWEVRRPTGPRVGATAFWTGRQVILWAGSDRRGLINELRVWPARLPLD